MQPARARAVDRMAAWGGTALYDVIVQALDMLGRQPGRRSIVLFSDGDDQSSHAPLGTAIERTEGSDATIYAIGQGRAVELPGLQKLMEQIATVSGGRAFFTDNPERLGRSSRRSWRICATSTLISYPASRNVREMARGTRFESRSPAGSTASARVRDTGSCAR